MTVEWKDKTSYSRGDKKRIPTIFALEIQGLRIVVTNSHIRHKPAWVMHCAAFGIDTHRLTADSLEAAQEEAIYEVKTLIRYFAASLDKF